MLGVLCTVYNEAKFLRHALNSVVEHVDKIVIVDGAYQETIALGAAPHSTDGTLDIIREFKKQYTSKVIALEANEKSDAQQRNVALAELKKLNCDWFMILDGDEIYKRYHFAMIKQAMRHDTIDVYYFTCNTFVNDFWHYTIQQFPRLFKLYPDTNFSNDNYVNSNCKNWISLDKKTLDVKYYHYAFVKDLSRFALKKKWWETRFKSEGRDFHYDWNIINGKIMPDNSEIVYNYIGSHPQSIIKSFNL